MVKQEQVVVVNLPSVIGFTIQEMVRDGWEIDPDMPVAQVGFNWECGFIRLRTPEQAEHDVREAAKPTRGEILAKARAAKAEKAKEGQA